VLQRTRDTLINWGSAPNPAGGNDFPRIPSLYLIEITMKVQGNHSPAEGVCGGENPLKEINRRFLKNTDKNFMVIFAEPFAKNRVTVLVKSSTIW
jgi:hypothetical protein